jgi:hypothetical protein
LCPRRLGADDSLLLKVLTWAGFVCLWSRWIRIHSGMRHDPFRLEVLGGTAQMAIGRGPDPVLRLSKTVQKSDNATHSGDAHPASCESLVWAPSMAHADCFSLGCWLRSLCPSNTFCDPCTGRRVFPGDMTRNGTAGSKAWSPSQLLPWCPACMLM